jgi:hypothetical protein
VLIDHAGRVSRHVGRLGAKLQSVTRLKSTVDGGPDSGDAAPLLVDRERPPGQVRMNEGWSCDGWGEIAKRASLEGAVGTTGARPAACSRWRRSCEPPTSFSFSKPRWPLRHGSKGRYGSKHDKPGDP